MGSEVAVVVNAQLEDGIHNFWSLSPFESGIELDSMSQSGGSAFAVANLFTATASGVTRSRSWGENNWAQGHANATIQDNITFIDNGFEWGESTTLSYTITYSETDSGILGEDVWGNVHLGQGLNAEHFRINTTQVYSGEIALSSSSPTTDLFVAFGVHVGGSDGFNQGSITFSFDPLPEGVSFTSESGTFLRGDLYEPSNVIVLTHGWQPGFNAEQTGESGLPEVRAALEERLDLEGIREDTLIIEFFWPEAFTPPTDYFDSLAYAQNAGMRLAQQVYRVFDDISDATGHPFDPNLHFIGHSLGTVVNGHAIQELTRPETSFELGQQINVDQVTILDSPLAPAGTFHSLFSHESFFHEVLSSEQVRYVENFYATEDLVEGIWPFDSEQPALTLTPQFGQSIFGTGPLEDGETGGSEFEGTDHITLLSEYADLVRGDRLDPNGNGWNSPVLSSWQSMVDWHEQIQPRSFRQILDAIIPVGAPPTDSLIVALNETETESDFALNLPTGLTTLEFEIVGGEATRLGLFVGDEAIWRGSTGNSNGIVSIPLFSAEGGVKNFSWELLPEHDGEDVAVTLSLFERVIDNQGSTGNDRVIGQTINNTLFGLEGNDTLWGADLSDMLHGGEGDDAIFAGAGSDTVFDGSGSDFIEMGNGEDIVSFTGDSHHLAGFFAFNVSSDLQVGTQTRIDLEGLVRIEAVTDGGADADIIRLSSEGDAFFLHDAYSGFHSSVTLTEDYVGNESTARFANVEEIRGMGGDDIIDLTSPDYSLAGVAMSIDGGEGNDVIWGSDANEHISGGSGNDTIFGGIGTDVLTGGAGADVFEFTRTSTDTSVTDFDAGEGDALRFYNAGGAEFDVSSVALTANGIAISYTDTASGTEHDISIALAISAADFTSTLPEVLNALEII